MKKRIFLFMAAALLSAASVMSRPALKGTRLVTQPDGTTVTLRLIGDEYLHYTTTSDGYTLVRNTAGYYVYAQLDAAGQLAPTSIVAHDAQARLPQELDYINQAGRVVPTMTQRMSTMRRQNRAAQAQTLADRHNARYNYANFKGLIIIIEYNDQPFRYSDYKNIMENMINQDNYTGESRTNGSGYNCVGSMRDYFRDNSMGQFVPTFDIVGPVQVNHSKYEGHNSSDEIFYDACRAVNDSVNFKDYDTDNDGKVDMIYFIVSGLPSYIQGNDDRLLWPHQYDLSYYHNYRFDNVRLARYACSTELYGTSSWSILEGIGTMCHEFSHVLGLPDFYDTDYSEGTIDPGEWSIMANGADYNYGRRPCSYSLFERYALGFSYPATITEPGDYTLENLSQSNAGLRINTQQANEYFLLENRQKTKWDAELPGHGMLVFRVDSTNTYVWEYNKVNNNASHPYYELKRARGPQKQGGSVIASSMDPFPGTGRVTTLDNSSSPTNLRSWAGKETAFGLVNITETNGKITFRAYDATSLGSLTTAETASLGVGTSFQLTAIPYPAGAATNIKWESMDEQVVTVSQTGLITGVAPGTAKVVVSSNAIADTCLVTVVDAQVVSSIAEFLAIGQDNKALLKLNDAQVLYVNTYKNKHEVYLRDATGSIVLNSTGISVSRNDILTGTIGGQLTMRQGDLMPQLSAVANITKTDGIMAEAGEEAQPTNIHISQLSAQNYADMVKVEKVQMVLDGAVYAICGEQRIRVFNTFGISMKLNVDYSKRYDITAIYATNVLSGNVINELCLLEVPKEAAYTELTAINISPAIHLPVGREVQLSAELTPLDADAYLFWSSSNDQVATVNQQGLVTTVASGNAVITVRDLNTGLEAQCLVTVGERIVVNSIAEFKALPQMGEAFLTLSDAQVIYVYRNDAYLRDATGAIRLTSTGLPLTLGNVLNGRVYGIYSELYNMPQFLQLQGSTNAEEYAVTDGEQPQPRTVTLDEVDNSLLADLITVKAVKFVEAPDGLKGGFVVTPQGNYIRMYNLFGLKNSTMPSNPMGKYFDVTGILVTDTDEVNQGNLEIAWTMWPVEVDEPSGIATLSTDSDTAVSIYTADGRFVTTTTLGEYSRLSLRPGLYLLHTSAGTTKIVRK
ncbi:MAG: M6 family metalloprotease domain-containing protein [Prevotella sp.]|nr:M6 family metalloprotease domain-containing protein [Prevotella sp.]